ncbi:MAG: ABC transporter permease [Jiangellales bacterium]
MTDAPYAPAPGAAPYSRMVMAQTRLETSLILRNGEQLLLTLIIPLVLLALLAGTDLVDISGSAGGTDADPVAVAVAGVLTVAVMSTAFTGLAIATGFERRYGVLRRLAVTPLPRSALLLGKALAVLAVEVVQVLLIVGLGLLLGWSGEASWPGVVLLVLVGTAAFAGLGMLMAGTLRAEATLAAANLVYILLLVAGAALVPVSRYPEAVQPVLAALPSGALGEGLRAVLVDGGGLPWAQVGILAVWAVLGLGMAARWFRWE